jgi:DNA polymerase-3 subunit delta'
MFDDYKNGQALIYNFLLKSVNNSRISHAYLFETENLKNKMDFALSFAKFLICPNHKTNNKDCKNCSICNRIAANNFPEIKIIEPDGLWIKKEQVSELQNEFSKKAVEGDKRIYIINNCEKLNKYAANSILKFLEEPEDGIIAILLADNMHQVLDTIVSRCQVFSFKKHDIDINKADLKESNKTINKLVSYFSISTEDFDKKINDEKFNLKIDSAINFVLSFEKEKQDLLLFVNKNWNNYFDDKESILIGFQIMILFYKDVLNFMCNQNIEVFTEYIDNIKMVANLNDIIKITKKIKILLSLKEKIPNNINSNLLIDNLIINMMEI